MSEVLEVKGFSLSILEEEGDISILRDIDMQISSGEVVGLFGDSGSGKSMLAKSILGLSPTDHTSQKGQIIINGLNLSSSNESDLIHVRKEQIGLIFQQSKTLLNPIQTIGKQIGEKISYKRPKSQGTQKQVIELLESVDLRPGKRYIKRYVHELSGGQVQRALIALALANNPQLIIADEPVSALDSKTKEDILRLLENIHQTRQIALLIISHDPSVIHRLCHRVYEISQGVISPSLDINDWRYNKKAIHPNTLENKKDQILIEINGLIKSYDQSSNWFSYKKEKPTLIFDKFSFKIYRGEILGIHGSSGSGKSTLAHILSRLESFDGGSIIWEGEDIQQLNKQRFRAYRAACQIIFQDAYSSLAPHRTLMSQFEDIILVKPTLTRNDINTILVEMNLEEKHLSRYPRELSGGQRKRMVIAKTLLLEPEFIICDEILAGLDQDVASKIIELFTDKVKERGITLLYISHDLDMISRLSDRVIDLDNYSQVEAE